MGTKRTRDTGRVDSLGRPIKESENLHAAARPSGNLGTARGDFVHSDREDDVHIDDILDPAELEEELAEKFVKRRTHPADPDLAVINYTQSAQFAGRWNDVTRAARGLIYRTDSGVVQARPWQKFFNHSEMHAAHIGADERVQVTDKMDGSLGVPYWSDEGLRLATKGSFDNEQTRAGQKLLDQYDTSELPEGWTPLFEIIYPENRIVLDYGRTRDVYLLGGVHIGSGRVAGPTDEIFDGWDGPRAQVFEDDTLADALRRSPRDNAEGIIVRSLDTGNMVKIKQEDYVRLHKVRTGLSTIGLWESMKNNEFDLLLENVPDEMYDTVHEHYDRINAEYARIENMLHSQGREILDNIGMVPDTNNREFKKAFALEAKRLKADKMVISMFLGNKPVSNSIWERIRPQHSMLGTFNSGEPVDDDN